MKRVYEKYLGDIEIKASEAIELEEEENMATLFLVIAVINAVLLVPSLIGYLVFNHNVFLFFTLVFGIFALVMYIVFRLYAKRLEREIERIKERMDEQCGDI